jgi:hypothetical protein
MLVIAVPPCVVFALKQGVGSNVPVGDGIIPTPLHDEFGDA